MFPATARTEHYRARYGIHPVPQRWSQDWSGSAAVAANDARLSLPVANAFIPRDFTRFPAASVSEVPELQLDLRPLLGLFCEPHVVSLTLDFRQRRE